jgi:hypothetical protein
MVMKMGSEAQKLGTGRQEEKLLETSDLAED